MEHRQGHIQAESRRAGSVSELLFGSYDLLLCAPSWDSRCTCITTAEQLTVGNALVFDFRNIGELGLRSAHDQRVREFVSSHCDRATLIRGKSEDLETTWSAVQASVLDVVRTRGRPIRLLIDISTCPRFYALGALAFCLEAGLAESITVFYAEGAYPEQTDDQARHEMFTIGRWETVAVPFLEGSYDPGKSRFYYVSVGFEGSKTMRVVARADPDRVSVLFPKPGVDQSYEAITHERNRALLEAYRIPDEQIVCAPAGDAVAAWQAMDAARLERPEDENTSYICCGTKAHSLALALRSLALGYPAVLYNKPDEHKEIAVRPNGVYWSFEVRDASRREAAEYRTSRAASANPPPPRPPAAPAQ